MQGSWIFGALKLLIMQSGLSCLMEQGLVDRVSARSNCGKELSEPKGSLRNCFFQIEARSCLPRLGQPCNKNLSDSSTNRWNKCLGSLAGNSLVYCSVWCFYRLSFGYGDGCIFKLFSSNLPLLLVLLSTCALSEKIIAH